MRKFDVQSAVLVLLGGVLGGGIVAFFKQPITTEPDSNSSPDPVRISAISEDGTSGERAQTPPTKEVEVKSTTGVAERLAEADDPHSKYQIARNSIAEIIAGGAPMVDEILADLDPQTRARLLPRLVYEWVERDPAGALGWLAQLDVKDLEEATRGRSAIINLAKTDPLATSKLIDSLPQNDSVLDRYASIAQGWASIDPVAAAEWAEGLELGGVRKQALQDLYRTWAREDPKSAIEHASKIENQTQRRHFIAQLATDMVRSDGIESVLEWSESIDGESRIAALSSAMGQLGGEDIEKSRQLLEEILADPAAEGLAGSMIVKPVEKLAAGMFEESPEAATKWALAIENDAVQQHAIEGIARARLGTDVVAASEWISTLPAGNGRDGAIFYLVEEIKRTDPATAFRWAEEVGNDAEKQRYLLHQSIYQWNAIDPAAARSALEASGIGEPVKKLLRAVGSPNNQSR